MARTRLLWLLLPGLLAAGCAGGGGKADLEAYIQEVLARPAGEIEPLPSFRPYRPYKYQHLALRSPFQPPRVVEGPSGGRQVPPPDETRPKEFLESIPFASLTMVGTLEQDGAVWALIDDGSGGIHRVTVGNYLGKNHGRIVAIAPTRVDVVEVVPDGRGGWIERPRTLTLKGLQGNPESQT
ncbi:MAG: type 4 fimbrial biogenesis protein PilP [Porticoccaceae bacterium]|nr:MAG: type 4 fimbrial biogenesis protein PilP [Porticoccaceae bacterium]